MGLTAVETSGRAEKAAIAIEVNGRRVELSQAAVDGLTAEQVKAALETAASLSNVALPAVTVHVNRDGSVAIATGKLPEHFVWPEDLEEEREARG